MVRWTKIDPGVFPARRPGVVLERWALHDSENMYVNISKLADGRWGVAWIRPDLSGDAVVMPSLEAAKLHGEALEAQGRAYPINKSRMRPEARRAMGMTDA